MRASNILLSIVVYISLAVAWPWPPDLQKIGDALVRRQDSSSASSQPAKSSQAKSSGTVVASTADGTKSAAESTAAASGSSVSKSAKPTASASDSAAASTNPPSKTTAKDSSSTGLAAATSIPPNAPPGGISLISPAALTTTYFKIGANITLAWNYTSLLAPPSAIDVYVTNSVSTYTLTQNASVAATPTVFWDTKQYEGQENPIQNAFYTLAVVDAGAGGITAAPSPGHLSPFGVNAQFGLYATQAYVPLADFVCPNCNGAISSTEIQTLKFLGIMFSITLLTFTWFANGFLSGF
ncbi:hypothetical protein MMC10_008360 [Thelotrema lepadinum]|nr:hypothetical protein [Thelotrema lepadinum]